MTPIEDIFGASRLEILVPDERIRLSSLDTLVPTWWSNLTSRPQRSLAFFDERLYLLLALRLSNTPESIASFLERLQVSLEASYISPFIPSSQAPRSPRPAAANPSLLLQGTMIPKLRASVPLIPPTTPNPVPTTSATDRPYAHADSGVSLQSYIWGDGSPPPALKNQSSEPPPKDEFMIAWSEEEKSWVVIYELHVSVTFLQTRVSEPLLCLTVSATLRDKALLTASHTKILRAALAARNLPFEETHDLEIVNSDGEEEDIMHGMAEVNLLSGLNDGVTFNSTEFPMSLPSSRVGPTIRRQAFSMVPLLASASRPDTHHSPSPSSSSILRKSYRKTLRTVEGIKVRMRSCYVPFVPSRVLNGSDGDVDTSEEDEDAGSEERTVILSVEMENSNESGLGFFIEQVNITVDGDRAKTALMGWGSKPPSEIFPFILLANGQTNLLYSVSSLSPPHSATPQERKRQSTLSNRSDGSIDGMQRLVAIVVKGHPYRPEDPTQEGSAPVHLETFSSRWTCILDLVATQQADPNSWYSRPSSPLSTRDALPMPASPYPATFSSGSYQRERDRNSQTSSKMFAQRPGAGSSPLTPSGAPAVPHRASAGGTLSSAGKFVPSPPSAVVAAMNAQANNAGPSPLRFDKSAITGALSSVPLTPAFPSYSEGPPATPNSQLPLGPVIDNSSLPHEAYRERLGSTIVPAAPQPRDGGTTSQGGEVVGNMVVSVTLLPPLRSSESPRRIKRRIFPMDVFSLEVFVLNASPIVRRCEVGYPEKRRRRQGTADSGGKSTAGVMPLDNRIRVGPLLPGSSQSVRIRVLALSPGVHMIDALTLTDVATSYTINLRSVMTVVVEELDPSGTP